MKILVRTIILVDLVIEITKKEAEVAVKVQRPKSLSEITLDVFVARDIVPW